MCTAPYEKEIKVAIKKVEGGLFSSFANEYLKNGDILEVLPPVGKFNAKKAIRNGADAEMVRQRLMEAGIDPSKAGL